MKQLVLEVCSSVIQNEGQKQLVCAKGWCKVKCMLVNELVTLGSYNNTIGGNKSCTILYMRYVLIDY